MQYNTTIHQYFISQILSEVKSPKLKCWYKKVTWLSDLMVDNYLDVRKEGQTLIENQKSHLLLRLIGCGAFVTAYTYCIINSI